MERCLYNNVDVVEYREAADDNTLEQAVGILHDDAFMPSPSGVVVLSTYPEQDGPQKED